MKKIISFSVVLILLSMMLGLNFGMARAGAVAVTPTPAPTKPVREETAPKVFLSSPYFSGLGAGTRIPAQVLIESNLKKVECVATSTDGTVVCTIPKKYAGQSVTLYLTVGDQVLIFYANVPNL